MNLDCWVIGDLFIRQAPDGFVLVDKKVNGQRIYLRASPGNGKVKLGNSHIQVSSGTDLEGFVVQLLTAGLCQSGTGEPLLPEVWTQQAPLQRHLQGLHRQELCPQRRLRRGGRAEDLLSWDTVPHRTYSLVLIVCCLEN